MPFSQPGEILLQILLKRPGYARDLQTVSDGQILLKTNMFNCSESASSASNGLHHNPSFGKMIISVRRIKGGDSGLLVLVISAKKTLFWAPQLASTFLLLERVIIQRRNCIFSKPTHFSTFSHTVRRSINVKFHIAAKKH